MAKQKIEQKEIEPVPDIRSKAVIAFDVYKARMDAFYEKELRMKHHIPTMPPPVFGPPPPAYIFPPQESFYARHEEEKPGEEEECKSKQLPLIDSLAKLLELSFKTVNLSLTSGVTILNRLSGFGDDECYDEYDCGGCPYKHGYGIHDEHCGHYNHGMCGHCHTSVNNC